MNENKAQSKGLDSSSYEIIRKRLENSTDELRNRIASLNDSRKKIFGALEFKLLDNQRITTENNCTPRDITPIGNKFLFGYNVHIGLKSHTDIKDVFTLYDLKDGRFIEQKSEGLQNPTFEKEFQALYKYYKNTFFARFVTKGPFLYMIFQIGKEATNIKTFKWAYQNDKITYIDNRSDHECTNPSQYDFEWKKVSRENFRSGKHPHVSIADRLFVETVGGDLTIKVEDNTDSGSGIYAEPVDNPDQTLDDAEFFYSELESVIILKIKPYQETEYRFYAYSDKTNKVEKIKKLGEACIILPDSQGIIFSNGFFLQNGTYKVFENDIHGLTYQKRIIAPNGEDYLYVFLEPNTGNYVLLSYNIINRDIEAPIFCNGFSCFDDGRLIYFKSSGEPQKSHNLQIWKTPFTHLDYELETDKESMLYKIGNRELVAVMAQSQEIIKLIDNKLDYETLYIDINKNVDNILKTHYWLHEQEAFNLKESFEKILQASNSAIDEYEKVRSLKKIATNNLIKLKNDFEPLKKSVTYANHQAIEDFVKGLNDLRKIRGETISAKDTRYIDLQQLDLLETQIAESTNKLSAKTTDFLSKPEALLPFQNKIKKIKDSIPETKKTTVGNEKSAELEDIGINLQMLIEIVGNLKIDDPTKTTEIIENISTSFSSLNQVKVALKKKIKEIGSLEGANEFNSQLKLLEQSVSNFLEMANTTQQCEESLTRVMVQLEELESKFSEFDEFMPKIADKRDDFINAFETKKINIEEARNKKAGNLVKAAERILLSIGNRTKQFKEIDELNGYFATDLMVDKLRDIIQQLMQIGETVKAEDLESKVKTQHENGIRSLKDKKELFADGDDIIQLGKQKFLINKQELDLTIVPKNDEMYFHLKGTAFFEKIEDESFLETKSVWSLDLPSENLDVYRSEFLAWSFYNDNPAIDYTSEKKDAIAIQESLVTYMSSKYDEGYIKGVHDQDAGKILLAIAKLDEQLQTLKFTPNSRSLARLFWSQTNDNKFKKLFEAKLLNLGTIKSKFKTEGNLNAYVAELKIKIDHFMTEENIQGIGDSDEAAEYLCHEIMTGSKFKIYQKTADSYSHFSQQLISKMAESKLNEAIDNSTELLTKIQLIQDWYWAFANDEPKNFQKETAYDVITTYLLKEFHQSKVSSVTESLVIPELQGSHGVISKDGYHLNFILFRKKLIQFQNHIVPMFRKFREVKKELVATKKEKLRLEELKPRVLSSFVRNKLLDKVYLPLIGDNFAKQIGAAGDAKRTDRMGMLLLISPPGYGKTTLMEYISQILGLTFIKINGPSIGHEVTSLDPASSPNAGAKTEVEKLNLALEMGDNIMIYLDDIQHTNPEFLQKFISLCDGQRRIEGVYNNRPKTYDLRGKKVAVVMAGNPYTESGEKFRIPDMLANRADTYNLGDIIGDNADVFKRSYLENSLTSNSVLKSIAKYSSKDIHTLIDIAEKGERDNQEIAANLSLEEKNEIIKVIKMALRVRDVILKVNLQYIASAAQQDDYRTEPAFKMQGSYRNMNKIIEKIMSAMNDHELEMLIEDHYKNESQTLTTGAEANILKFHEMLEKQTPEEIKRWSEIKSTYQKKQSMMGADQNDPVARIVLQLADFNQGLNKIKTAIETSMDQAKEIAVDNAKKIEIKTEMETTQKALLENESLNKANNDFAILSKSLKDSFSGIEEGIIKGLKEGLQTERKEIEIVNKIPKFFVSLLQKQFGIMASWLQTIQGAEMQNQKDIQNLSSNIELAMQNHKEILNFIKAKEDKKELE